MLNMQRVEERVNREPLVRAITERLPAILTEVQSLLSDEHPEYADFLASEFDEVVTAGRGFVVGLLEQAVREPARVARGEQGVVLAELGGPHQALFEEIGRDHCRDGRDVTGLLAAYRVGAAVAWRHIVDEAMRGAVPTQSLAAVATTLFAAVDQLSAASLRGFMRQEAEDARRRDRTRERLAQLLLSDRCDSGALAAAAQAAGWTLPTTATLVLLGGRVLDRLRLPSLGEDCLWSRRPEMTIGIMPDPDGPGQRARLLSALRGFDAVVGESVDLARLPASLPPARLALALRERGVLSGDPLFVDQHLAALIVHHDPRLLEVLRHRVLAPLAELPEPTRQRLEQTLRCWLTQLGNRQSIAAELHVHPQTVRYRLAQLRELFGPDLDDPGSRAAMTVALVWGGPAPGGPERDRRGTDWGAGEPVDW